jgi:hypothetical protein
VFVPLATLHRDRSNYRGLGQSSGITPIVQAITTQENANPAYNNPGNLMASSWTQSQPGYVGASPGGIAMFSSPAAGNAALTALIQNYANNGATIQSMMAAYAPASVPGNNPTLYAQNVAAAAGVSVDTPLSQILAGSVSDGSGGDLVASSDNPISDALGISQYGVTDVGLGIGAAVVAGLLLVQTL